MTIGEIVFEEQLTLINDPGIKEFVSFVFKTQCPNYFWKIPASSGGHYHPKLSSGEGGLVRHTKLAVRFADSFMDCWPSVPHLAHDEVIAATLLHDIFKRGEDENELVSFQSHKEAVGGHGVYAWRHLQRELAKQKFINEESFNHITIAIRDHMGKWTTGYRQDTDKIVARQQAGHVVCITTHMADFAASRPLDQWLLWDELV